MNSDASDPRMKENPYQPPTPTESDRTSLWWLLIAGAFVAAVLLVFAMRPKQHRGPSGQITAEEAAEYERAMDESVKEQEAAEREIARARQESLGDSEKSSSQTTP